MLELVARLGVRFSLGAGAKFGGFDNVVLPRGHGVPYLFLHIHNLANAALLKSFPELENRSRCVAGPLTRLFS